MDSSCVWNIFGDGDGFVMVGSVDAQFRGTKWGMNKIEVKSIEKLSCDKAEEFLACSSETIIGVSLNVLYEFKEDRLIGAGYMTKNGDLSLNSKKASLLFYGIVEILNEKYNVECTVKKEYYSSSAEDMYSNEEDEHQLLNLNWITYNMAVELPKENTVVVMKLSAENGLPGLLLYYKRGDIACREKEVELDKF